MQPPGTPKMSKDLKPPNAQPKVTPLYTTNLILSFAEWVLYII